MILEYVPLLQIQRELHGIPRGRERFLTYLQTIASKDGPTLELPSLLIMNPMGREHVTALLDELLAMDADGIAARTAAEVSARLPDIPGDFKLALVIADDLKGGWTNRYDYEFALRFGPEHLRTQRGTTPKLPRWLKHIWLNGVLWSSEPATERAIREAILTAAYRVAYVHEHGPVHTIRDMLAQEGHVMAQAGCTGPVLDSDDIAYSREVLVPYLDATDMRTAIECLFGDTAGRTLGFTPRGLSHWAGLTLALHDARAQQVAG